MPYRQPADIVGKPFVIFGTGLVARRIAMIWLTRGGTVHFIDPIANAKELAEHSHYILENLGEIVSALAHGLDGEPGKLFTFQKLTEAVKDAWIVLETIPGNLTDKIRLLGELDALLPDDCILASNTSDYRGSEMFDKVQNKERFVTTYYHDDMLPQLFPLEIMPNPCTSLSVVDLLSKEAARHGLRVINVRKESSGLLLNRLRKALTHEAQRMVAEGLSDYEQVGSIMKEILGVSGEAAGISSKDRLILLEVMKGEIQTLSTDGATRSVLISGLTSMPDGVQIDNRPGKGHIYWTNMGTFSNENNGFLSRANLDGSDVRTIVPVGVTRTPKQLVLDTDSERLYWCDREGCRIMRCNLDGSQVETLYASAITDEERKDPRAWCVGLVLDKPRGLLYWTQKGTNKGWCGKILRANIELPPDATPESRPDVEVLFSGMPEPIHLEFHDKFLYWTDRGDPPFGNTLNRADVSHPLSPDNVSRGPGKDLVIAERFHEAMGLTIDRVGRKVYVCDLSGTVWVTELDGTNKKALQREVGTFTGITFHLGA